MNRITDAPVYLADEFKIISTQELARLRAVVEAARRWALTPDDYITKRYSSVYDEAENSLHEAIEAYEKETPK